MYHITEMTSMEAEPWKTTLACRMARFNAAIRNGQKVCAHLYEQADSSTFRYRVYNLAQITEDDCEWTCVYFFCDEMKRIASMLERAILLVMVRLQWTRSLDTFIKRLRQKGVTIVFDVDDMVFDPLYVPEVMNVLRVGETKEEYNYWFASIGRMEMTASLADVYTTTNEFLGNLLAKKFARPVGVVPNFLNDEQLKVSAHYRRQKKISKSKMPFTVGYFSGTPSHGNDFRICCSELITLLEKYSDMRLLVLGYMELPQEMHALQASGKVILHPLVDFIALQKWIASVDVTIAPLAESVFTHCKSDLKFFEAAVVDTPTLATPTYAFMSSIRQGENGFLCREGDWFTTIESLYLGEIDGERIVAAARHLVLETYCGEPVKKVLCEVYDRLSLT